MIPLEGRVLLGLDEFMLRLGHLKVLCGVGVEFQGSQGRVERETAKVLTGLHPVPPELNSEVAEYLLEKHLCPSEDQRESPGTKVYRYSELVVKAAEEKTLLLRTAAGDSAPHVWWQDLCLSQLHIRSRVGAVTVGGKSGSKTGLSHIFDWAISLDLLGPGGAPSPVGRLLATPVGNTKTNPYVIEADRVLLAFAFLERDLDAVSRLLRHLKTTTEPIKKADAAAMLVATAQEITDEAERERRLSTGRRRRIYLFLKDLERATKHGTTPIEKTSTAWHRASSRMETLVDLGLLEKGRGGPRELYEYVYYRTASLDRAIDSLESAATAQQWLEDELVNVIFGEQSDEPLAEELLIDDIADIVSRIGRPTAVVPIAAVSLGLVVSARRRGAAISLACARAAIERLARTHSEWVRLARGNYSSRAESVSFDRRMFKTRT